MTEYSRWPLYVVLKAFYHVGVYVNDFSQGFEVPG